MEEYVLDGKWVVNGQIHVIKGEPMGKGWDRISARRYVFTSTGTRKQNSNFPNRARFVDICGKTSLFTTKRLNSCVYFDQISLPKWPKKLKGLMTRSYIKGLAKEWVNCNSYGRWQS